MPTIHKICLSTCITIKLLRQKCILYPHDLFDADILLLSHDGEVQQVQDAIATAAAGEQLEKTAGKSPSNTCSALASGYIVVRGCTVPLMLAPCM